MSGNNKLYQRKMAPLTCKRSCTERKLRLRVSVSKAPFKLKILSKQLHPTCAPAQSKISESLSYLVGGQELEVSLLWWLSFHELVGCWSLELPPMYMFVKTWQHQGSNSARSSFILLIIDCNFSIRIICLGMITVKIIYLDGFGQRIFHIW